MTPLLALLAFAHAATWESATASTIGPTAEWSNKVELADLDGDGWVDIVFANGGDYSTPGSHEANRVFLNGGPGAAFVEATSTILPTPDLTRVIKARDLDGDGHVDLVVGGAYGTQTKLFLGDGTGGYTDATAQLPALNLSVGDLEVGDVDDDGDLDLVLADWGPGNALSNAGGITNLWLNDGTGSFTDVTAAQMPALPVKFSWDMELLDVDNDYDLDVLVSCKSCNGSFLFHNDGTGSFTDASALLPRYGNNYEFEPLDYNGDGYLDLVTINDGPNLG